MNKEQIKEFGTALKELAAIMDCDLLGNYRDSYIMNREGEFFNNHFSFFVKAIDTFDKPIRLVKNEYNIFIHKKEDLVYLGYDVKFGLTGRGYKDELPLKSTELEDARIAVFLESLNNVARIESLKEGEVVEEVLQEALTKLDTAFDALS